MTASTATADITLNVLDRFDEQVERFNELSRDMESKLREMQVIAKNVKTIGGLAPLKKSGRSWPIRLTLITQEAGYKMHGGRKTLLEVADLLGVEIHDRDKNTAYIMSGPRLDHLVERLAVAKRR